jgi:hypothetical protein
VNAGRIRHGSGLTCELIVRDLDLRPLLVIRLLAWQQPRGGDPRRSRAEHVRVLAIDAGGEAR